MTDKEKPKKSYELLCETKSDINEHLPRLMELAKGCRRILECGVRGVVSSYAFAEGLQRSGGGKLILNDVDTIHYYPLKDKYPDLDIQFIQCSDLDLDDSEYYNLIFIDTYHVYGQLKRELEKFKKMTNVIVLFNTAVDGKDGEAIRTKISMYDLIYRERFMKIPIAEQRMGMTKAIEEFVEDNPWEISEQYENNNGLTILKALSPPILRRS